MAMINRISSVLSTSAEREINPYLFRLTAITETTKARGAVENITLGPSQVSGWPQQNVMVSPKPTKGIALSNNAMLANITNLL